MIGQERPGVDGEGAGFRQRGQAGHELVSVGVVPENGAPRQAPHYHVVEGIRGIEAGLAGHGISDA